MHPPSAVPRHAARGRGAPHPRGGGYGHAQRNRPAPSADDDFRGRARADRKPATALAAADACRTGAGALHHGTRTDGLRRLDRSRRADDPARHRQRQRSRQSDHGTAGPDRRSSAVHGADGAPYRRRLSVDAGRPRRSGARPRLGALRFERHGRRHQHRNAQDARRRRTNRDPRRLRLLQHAPDRSDEPRESRPFHQRGDALLQPHRRPPQGHGLRPVRRLRQTGLRARRGMGCMGRRERYAFRRRESGYGPSPDLRQRLAHHARHDLVRAAQRLRHDLGRSKLLLQLGPPQDQRRLLGGRDAARLPFQLARPDAGRLVVPERHALPRQPADGGRRLPTFRRQGVEPLYRRTARPDHGRRNDGRGGRLRRLPPDARRLADARRRHPHRPPLARGHGVDPAGRSLVPSAPRCPDQGHGEQGIPFSDHPRDVHVPAAESRSETRTADELRTLLLATAAARSALVRSRPLLYRRREHDHARTRGRPPDERQHRQGAQLRRRSRNCVGDRRRMVGLGQLQLASHEISGRRRPRTQTLRRRPLFARPLERFDRHPVCPQPLHVGLPRHDGQLRAVERRRELPSNAVARTLRPRREPARATL